MTITDDEFSVLMIADRGEYMLAIGRWQKPTEDLTRKGFLKCEIIAGGPQYSITPAGREAIVGREAEDDKKLGAIIEQGHRIGTAHKTAREHAEAAAQAIAECAKASSPMTGDTPEAAARKWAPIVLERALDIINHG
jgi:hypothetical protein